MNWGRFLEESVLPALYERLDDAFPEFGWVRSRDGWVATNRTFTKEAFGARPDRIVCRRPFGFLVHGGEPMTWTAYVSGGRTARGADFPRAVQELARRAGICVKAFEADASSSTRSTPDELTAALRTVVARSVELRMSRDASEAADAEAHLRGRGISDDLAGDAELGVTPREPETLASWFPEDEKDAAHELGLLHPGWANRLVGPWKGQDGEPRSLFGRSFGDEAPPYLLTKGTRPPLFGLPLAPGSQRVILVEGVFDALRLREAGILNAFAVGGARVTEAIWSFLISQGVRDVTLWWDLDRCEDGRSPGKEGLRHSLAGAPSPRRAPHVFVIDPGDVARAAGHQTANEVREKIDPQSFLEETSLESFHRLLAHRLPGPVYEALENGSPTYNLVQALATSGGFAGWAPSRGQAWARQSGARDAMTEGARPWACADALRDLLLRSASLLDERQVPPTKIAQSLTTTLQRFATKGTLHA